MHRRHDPIDVPAALGGYANALEVGSDHRLLFISGQIPETPDGLVPDDPEDQCRLVWSHVVSCLRSADMEVTDLVKVTTYLSDRALADVNTAVRREVLGEHRPALTVVLAGILDTGWKLEVEAIAAAPERPA